MFILLVSILVFSCTNQIVTTDKVPPTFNSGICFYGDAAKRIWNWLSSGKDHDHVISEVLRQRDCSSLDSQHDKSGIYKVYPDKREGLRVYCDTETDGGGWTVFLRRMDGTQDFTKNWKEYENGFGDLKREFWMGNAFIHRLTSNGKTEMRVDLQNFKNETRYAKYSTFLVGDADSKYTLTVKGYTGNADSIAYHNGRPFTTSDNDNDAHKDNCASFEGRVGSGWWYNAWDHSSLTLNYARNGNGKSGQQLVQWERWTDSMYSIKYASMMIRRV